MNNGVQSCWGSSQGMCGMRLRLSCKWMQVDVGAPRAKPSGRGDTEAACMGIVHRGWGKPRGELRGHRQGINSSCCSNLIPILQMKKPNVWKLVSCIATQLVIADGYSKLGFLVVQDTQGLPERPRRGQNSPMGFLVTCTKEISI